MGKCGYRLKLHHKYANRGSNSGPPRCEHGVINQLDHSRCRFEHGRPTSSRRRRCERCAGIEPYPIRNRTLCVGIEPCVRRNRTLHSESNPVYVGIEPYRWNRTLPVESNPTGGIEPYLILCMSESNPGIEPCLRNRSPKMTRAGFEPAPPKRMVPKTIVLDHSTNEPGV